MTSTFDRDTPFPIELTATPAGLTRIRILLKNNEYDKTPPTPEDSQSQEILTGAQRQLVEYFAGRRQSFDLPLTPAGTPFQQQCWQELQRIPFGTTISYAELAQRVGNPNACRAVGAANGRNPLPIVIPCHRVIGSSGKLHGFAYGLDIKRLLIDLEIAASRSSGDDVCPPIETVSGQLSIFNT
ncbi:MAG: methylated-DNA--[protein]-cysteine S-methyltransferase [Acidobacteria bacterium]|nr:methylated-DNA--[protein]-cysteine S-methyltransferase [Acidobacteriota bacterium]